MNKLQEFADGKDIAREKSAELYKAAQQYFPGGVNSPVRAFKSVFGTPLFIKKGDACHIWDADDNQFIDFCCSWGPLILGHNHPKVKEAIIKTVELGTTFGAPTQLENELAALILNNNQYIDKLRFVSSGTEAVMSAIRLARGYAGKNKIIKFEGCYHGHVDSLLVKAGSGLVTFGETSSAGVPEAFAKETIVLPLNNLNAVQQAFEQYKDEIAGVIIEGIPANNGLLIQDRDYMHQLKNICMANNALLILDEVITGFRLGFEGAAAYYGIQPDLITYGKVIGGGMPVGCYGGRAEIMSRISPEGDVYQAGTLSGNPVAMAAGIAQLSELLRDGFYERLNKKTENFIQNIQKYISERGFNVLIQQIGSVFWFAFTDKPKIQSAAEIDHNSMDYYKVFHKELLNRGVYFGPSGYEVGFVSDAHTENELKKAQNAIKEALNVVFMNQKQ